MEIRFENGIFLPVNYEELLKAKKEWAYKEFHKRHSDCPLCKEKWSGWSTCMGFMYHGDDEIYKYYYDDNYISCECGFHGTRTDLIEGCNHE